MMIDPILSLAFGIQSNKGAYALLLGSGISRAAEIPTGWEVVVDLIRKLAAMKGASCEPNPVDWYQNTFNDVPDYNKLLNAVAKFPSERSQLLKSYFEPREEDREQGRKLPTQAHKAIARLVSNGYIRAIITTNFDRLLEQAMEGLGTTPTVISTPDAVEGALPLIHTRCTIVKLHGDYLDTRIKNTPSELSKYDKRIVRLLNRIFDEFGLIVCGWSAEWDSALVSAILRCQTHRFGTFWTVRGRTTDAANRLIKHRRAEPIKIKDANSFFQELEEKVAALDEFSKPHPLSVKVAIASLKRYITDDRYKIALHDLVINETERVYTEMQRSSFSLRDPIDTNTVSARIASYEALIEILLGIFATGCYWGEAQHNYLWCKCLDRLVNLPIAHNAYDRWNTMQRYLALRLLYAGGMTCLLAHRYETFTAILTKINVRSLVGEEAPLILALSSQSVMDTDVARLLPGMDNTRTPLSDHLFITLRDALKEFFPDPTVYEKTFDRFEYIRALVEGDYRDRIGKSIWGSPGRFAWRHYRLGDRSILRVLDAESAREGPAWGPIQARLFGEARFRIIKKSIDQLVSDLKWY